MQDHENPYASPAEPEGGEPLLADLDGSAKLMKPYASAKPRARWTVFFLAVILVGSIVSAISIVFQIDLLQRMDVGDYVAEESSQNDLRQILITLVLFVAIFGSMISFLMWFHRAHRNLPPLDNTGLHFSPSWAVVWWFVPLFNLFQPYQVMKEIWRGSDPSAVSRNDEATRRPIGTALISCWWALFLAMIFSRQIVLQLSFEATSYEALIAISWIILVYNLITVPAALLAIMVVRRVTANQEKRFRLVADDSGNEVETHPEMGVL